MTMPRHEVPSDRGCELGIIGHAVENPELLDQVELDRLFHDDIRTAVEVLRGMRDRGEPVTLATAGRRLPIELLAQAGEQTGAPFAFLRSVVREKACLRSIQTLCHDTLSEIPGATHPAAVLALMDRLVAGIAELQSQPVADEAPTMRRAIADWVESSRQPRQRIRTGIHGLDCRLRGGLCQGALVVLAGRPGTGKTALALNIAEHAALSLRVPGLFFSLEMARPELTERLVAAESGVEPRDNPNDYSQAETARMAQAAKRLAAVDLQIEDRCFTLPEILAKAKRWHGKGKGLVVIDYLGLVQAEAGRKSETKAETLGRITSALKRLAKELEVPVLLLAQLNRESARDGRPPRLHDLRDSGAIEQDADVVVLLHAPEDAAYTSAGRLVVADIAKQRNGGIGKLNLRFHGPTTRFAEDQPSDPMRGHP